ncbi:hypothetical protein [Aeoliella sp. SH292]|uniref:hypothetical protein n=1 Tax=Aeoliella sp. SH292 TaxID=3454464 RepID=UPI003F976A7B
MRRTFVCNLALGLALTAMVGCDSRGVRAVEGQVTLDGQPLKEGQIKFVAVEGTNSADAGASIENGHYKVPAVSTGLVANGVYRVEITSMVEGNKWVAHPNEPSGRRKLLENVIPAKYNTDSTLRVTVSSAWSENTHNFELSSTGS